MQKITSSLQNSLEIPWTRAADGSIFLVSHVYTVFRMTVTVPFFGEVDYWRLLPPHLNNKLRAVDSTKRNVCSVLLLGVEMSLIYACNPKSGREGSRSTRVRRVERCRLLGATDKANYFLKSAP